MAVLITDFSENAPSLAKRLLGCYLCFRDDAGVLHREMINETEAYFGEEDTACHAHRGKTARNAPLYEKGGVAYVYLCYGMYDLLNVVSGPDGHPEAVLIRGAGKYNGPGKLTKALGISRKENLCSLCGDRLWIEEKDHEPKFISTARIGIDYAEKDDRERLWRFVVLTEEK